jgi:1,4-alpha-glucan branching enzyme
MALRNFTLDSSRAYRGGYATDGLRADAVKRSYFPDALVPILDVDLPYEDASEPGGVNDVFVNTTDQRSFANAQVA